MLDKYKTGCYKLIKVGDILHITCDCDNFMVTMKYSKPTNIRKFPVVETVFGNPIVISHFDGRKIAACGTLIKIEKK